jgi:hypothetical protein
MFFDDIKKVADEIENEGLQKMKDANKQNLGSVFIDSAIESRQAHKKQKNIIFSPSLFNFMSSVVKNGAAKTDTLHITLLPSTIKSFIRLLHLPQEDVNAINISLNLELLAIKKLNYSIDMDVSWIKIEEEAVSFADIDLDKSEVVSFLKQYDNLFLDLIIKHGNKVDGITI